MNALPAGYELTGDQARIDPVAAQAYLSRSYWAKNVPLDIVERSIRGSLCVAVMHEGRQVAFARVVTDRATFAFLADVYVLEEHRGQGLARAMVRHFQAHPDLQGLRRWLLFTWDAHDLYESCGWNRLAHPEHGMERVTPGIYE